MSFSRRNFLIATGVVAASSSVLSACSSGNSGSGGTTGKQNAAKAEATVVKIGTEADSTGPAPEVSGAKKGGTVYLLNDDDVSHLDPQRIYYAWNSLAAIVLSRTLTGYKIADDGSQMLVGDLATDTGTMSDGGKTWAFTLKDGVKWEDGSDVTVDDVRHGIERAFASFITEGAMYVQSWLTGSQDYRKSYSGPYSGKHLKSVVTSGKTVTFHLSEARPDFNYVVAMQSYAPTPVKHDTKENYDKKPYSNGPYRVKSHVTDKSMVFVRNENWDPATDPIRNAYPDQFDFAFGIEQLTAIDRLLADSGKDQYAVSWRTIPQERVTKAQTEAKDRVFEELGSGVSVYWVNTTRVKDLAVREAIIKAWPTAQIRQLQGGSVRGDYATGIMSPLVAGYESQDVWGKLKTPAGDPAAAKKILEKAGKANYKIVYAYQIDDTQTKIKVVVENALKAAGFDVVTKGIDSTTWYDAIGKVDNPYDVYWGGWSADWPTGYSVFQPLFDSSTITDGGSNYAHLKDPKVDAAIKAATAETDQDKANKMWAALDKQVTETGAFVPDVYMKRIYLHGSKLGNVKMDPNFDGCMLYKLYVK
ncbi:ABC transporter substrate-binding protein [Streptomyces sp. NBC_00620]|uniref:ABC transporter substrate-binding protein n=1 Tax=unclassified Streptomyces TaxID=2593676 RepID=UPI0022597C61|nr:ABC transporter substrate-binding protein [Streptomyces sp. NBC_00620]MCX4971643.1 ABC transporter substrate-binding protein [Streptomyces sp. NBC_00620]WUC13832.1 ABC transporter substrate-binding protein [Streptomyces sp. NBC_00564]WUC49659.1 ABC transporter substrate-binding protein [Streptomyces sp. NBC_00554]